MKKDIYMRENIRENESMKSISCPICATKEYIVYKNLDKYRFVKCSKCSTVYQNPQPKASDLVNRYDDKYFHYEEKNHDNFFILQQKTFNDFDFFNKFKPLENKKFLDIGAATGKLLNWMKNNKLDVQGVEICKASCEYAKKNFDIPMFNGFLHEGKFKDNMFDFIHFSHVIEHVPDTHPFISEVVRILKPGGYVFITTPDIGSIWSKIFGKKWRSFIPDHVVLFSKKTLKNLLKHYNLEIVFGESWGSIPVDADFKLFKPLFDKLVKRYDFGDVMFYIARK